MIVAAQMQDAVQHENFNFLGWRVSERARIFGCDLGRDGDFAGELFSSVGVGGKRKHVSGLVFSAETAVQGFYLCACRYQDIDCALQSGGAAGACDESVQRQAG